MNTDVLILGGGLAGLSTAYHLDGLGASSYLVVESRDTVGGTAGSKKVNGFTFDYTGHLLHLHDPYGKALILDLLQGNIASHDRRAWIFSQNVYTRYPFQANVNGLRPETVLECVAGFLKTVHRPKTVPSTTDFLSWSRATFGEGVTRHFMRPYNEKLWQTSLSRMTTQWQGRFVPKPSAAEVLYGALTDQNKLFGYNASFLYPERGGIQSLPDALARRLKPGVVKTNAAVEAIDLRQKIARVRGLGEIKYERLVNTLPLVDFLDLAAGLPAGVRAARRRLRYNTVWNLNLGIDRADVTDKHWIYYPEKKYPFYRVGCSSNFSRELAPAGQSSLYVEVSRPGGTRVDVKKLEASILKSLKQVGLLRRGDELTAREWMPIKVGYVVYDFNRTRAVDQIFNYLATVSSESIGRYGGWKYSFMEETILDGKRCAQRLMGQPDEAPTASTAELRPLK